MLDSRRVAVEDVGAAQYPPAPFHPATRYPEYPFADHRALADGPNPVYDAVRAMLRDLGLDAARVDTPAWNPLGDLVGPGATVVVKPNLVLHDHSLGQRGIEATVAHGAVIRPLIDYLLIALRGRGRIIVADSPLKEVDFDRIVERSGVMAIQAFYRDAAPIAVEVLDFRDRWVARNAYRFMTNLEPLPGDPAGYTIVDLGSESMFHELGPHLSRLRSTAVYYENVMDEFHADGHHRYSVPNTLLAADLVIMVTKLKTHRKSGVTLCLKNAVGITNEKRALPHHRVGSPSHGGDAVADGARADAVLEDYFRDTMLSHRFGRHVLRLIGPPLRTRGRQFAKWLFSRARPNVAPEATIVEGDWYGNDTVWRMVLDLNRVLMFTSRDGTLTNTVQRQYLGVIDGVIGGDGEGPLYPDPVEAGVVLAGLHPLSVDLVGATLMGYDWAKIPMLSEALRRDWPLRIDIDPSAIAIVSNRADWTAILRGAPSPFAFRPSAGWAGHIERSAAVAAPLTR